MISCNIKYRLIAISFFLVSGCGKGAETEKIIYPPRYWTKTGNETCGKMDGKLYCFADRYIQAKSFDSDAATGFLIYVPISNKDLLNCNKNNYSIENNYPGFYPFIRIIIGEVQYGDTFSKKYYRFLESKIGNSNNDIIIPKKEFNILGMNCLALKKDSFLKDEMMCHGGDLKRDKPAFFLSCKWDGSVPNPSCRDELFMDGIQYGISYNKKCLPFAKKIRQFMIDFVAAGRLVGDI